MAEITKISQYYGAGIMQENSSSDVLVSDMKAFNLCYSVQTVITEDAEVVSIETVMSP